MRLYDLEFNKINNHTIILREADIASIVKMEIPMAFSPEITAYDTGSNPFIARKIKLMTLPMTLLSVNSCAIVKNGTYTII